MQIQNVSYTNGNWNITMTGSEWPWMMKIAKPVRCPDCGSTHVRKNGTNYKFKKQYQCLNNDCMRSTFNID
jgi:predicted RNA-binding Zn-ribbon protein involved in translation (DUF1610 family)